MIKHDSLSNRINAVKNGKNIPEPPKSDHSINNELNKNIKSRSNKNMRTVVFGEIYKVLSVLLTSLLYGYGLKSLFAQHWTLLGTLGVGLLLNHSVLVTRQIIAEKRNHNKGRKN